MLQTKFKLPSIYNPASQTCDEIVANFVIRLKEFHDLFSSIKNDTMLHPPQHFIIQGQRGYGKTTLLLRLNFEIKHDSELSTWLIPVMFDEEQYSVRTLAKLWEEIIDYLAETDDSFSKLIDQIDPLYDSDSPEENIFSLLITTLQEQNKKLVLLLDNFGEMIEKFTRKEHQRLREVLITCNSLRIIGASSQVLEFYFNYQEPFFDFFKLITLDELTKEETMLLLKKLGETYKVDTIDKILEQQPERIEAIRRLTGGVPRTIVLLFEIFADDVDGNSFKDLETILDRVTPLYKHRLDNLSTQQQVIIDAIAQEWDAISTKEISKKIRMSSKAVSAQLNLLEKNQLIKKISTSTKNHLYQISERFFNIYYLMRLGRRKNKNKVLWLVNFFEVWCGKDELVERTRKHIKSLQENRLYEKHALYVSQALAKTELPLELHDELVQETRKYLSSKQSTLITEIDNSKLEILDEIKSDIKEKKYDIAYKKLLGSGFEIGYSNFILGDTIREIGQDYEKAEQYYLIAVDKGETKAMNNLAVLYKNEFKDFQRAEQYYMLAVNKGYLDAMYNLALLYEDVFKDFQKAEKYYLMAVEKEHENAMNNLALLYLNMQKKKVEALSLQRKAYNKIKALNVEFVFTMTLLWNNEIEEAIEVINKMFDNEKLFTEVHPYVQNSLLMLLAKKQYHYVYKIFTANKYEIKDKYKPIYYALLSLMGDAYKDEYKKMGPELKETAEEVLKEIEQLAIDYA